MAKHNGRQRTFWVFTALGTAIFGGLLWASMNLWNDSPEASLLTARDGWYGTYMKAESVPTQLKTHEVLPGERFLLSRASTPGTTPCQSEPSASQESASSQMPPATELARIREQGGIIALSSGAPGPELDELATRCEDTKLLENTYRELLGEYDSTVLDLYLDGADLGDPLVSERRVNAVSSLQVQAIAANEPIEVWLSLPVDGTELAPDAVEEVRRVLDGGAVDLAGVNLLLSDVGSEQDPTIHADNAILAIKNAHRQLKEIYELPAQDVSRETMSNDSIWMRIGITPMIDQGAQAGESLTSEDAEKLMRFALVMGLRRFSVLNLNP